MVLAFSVLAFTANAQTRTISGTVTSEDDGSELPGVNVVLKGTSVGTVTSIDGQYTLEVPTEGGTLVFSFIGLATKEVAIGAQSVVNVAMAQDVTELSEVVITGYGERNKESFTGSVASVGADVIENRPMPSVDQVLQGNVPGLQLSNSSGTPGSTQQIRIRGISSISTSNEPLFVIDGVPVVSGDNNRSTATGNLGVLASINPNDIESVQVLKDASATALYGARGTNGVIIITTKRGKSGKASFNFSAQYGGVDRAVDGPDMLNAAQWDELYYESLVNAGFYGTIAEAQANEDSGWDGVTDTDWNEEVKNDDAISQQYDFSARGGNEQTNYYVSLGYMQQDGVNVGSDFERVTGKVNLGTYLSEKFHLSNSLTASKVTQNGQLEGTAYFGNPDGAVIFMRPTDRPRNDDGTPNITDLSGVFFNPLYIAANDINERVQSRILNNTQLTVDIIPGLQYIGTVGLDFLLTEELYFDNRNYGDGAGEGGGSTMYSNRNFNYVIKNQLKYDFDLGVDHNFTASVVYEAQKNDYKTTASGGDGFAADGLYYPSSTGNPTFVSGFVNDWAINSIMGFVNYGFNNQLFIDASIRREGNSRFAPEYRWGTFYAFGAAWSFSENALFDNMDWLGLGKLRASYGKTGNAFIGLNNYQAFLAYSADYNGQPAVFPSQVGNEELTWENSFQFGVGLDLNFFDRVDVTVDYFNRETTDMLFNVPLSRTTGFTSQTQNIGDMVNKGWEVSAKGDVIRSGDFTWTLGFNFTSLENEVTKLPVDANGDEIGSETATQKITVGQPVNAWYMPAWAGVDPATGDALWYTDETLSETTSTYSQAGDVYAGGNALPTFFGGLNTRFQFKGVYLTADFYYSTGNQVYDSWAFYSQSDGQFTFTIANGYARQFDRWQQPGDVAENPRNVYGNTSQSNSASSRRLYDGEFLRLRNMTVGYTLPVSLVSQIGLTGVDIYFRGTNLFTWTKDENLEFDPEVDADGFLDLNAPALKVLTAGLNVRF